MEQAKVVEKPVPAFAECDRISGEVVTVYAVFMCDFEGKQRVVSYHLTPHEANTRASGLGCSSRFDGNVVPTLALKLSDGRYALAPEIIAITRGPEAEPAVLMGAPSK